MQSSQTPTLVPLAFAANGTKNTIPEASQIGITPGAASLNDGFPPLTFTPISAGGVPPSGADFNGVLNLITQSIRWGHAGGRYAFSSTFAADANVGGYPAGAVLMSADQQGSWLSLNDNNTDNPDTGPGTKWVPSHAYGITAITGLASSNVTLTPAQAMKSKITLAGTLTANVQIILPTWTRDWTVVNNTTGAFTVTAKTASGTGVTLAAGQQRITGDGTNIMQPAESVAAATQSQQAVQMGQLTGAIGARSNLKASCAANATTITFTADQLVLGTALNGLQYLLSSFNKTLNLATTGAGGMDTGTATAGGWLAVYAIYNPTTATSALLGTMETTAAATSVYSGANMPAGYTASALLAVIPVSSTVGQLKAVGVIGRRVNVPRILTFNTSSTTSTSTSIPLAGAVPKAAIRVSGNIVVVSTSSSQIGMALDSDNVSDLGDQNVSVSNSMSATGNFALDILTTQTIYYVNQNSTGTPTFSLNVSAYEI
ncbi:hypothetical protein [Burkholderia vietnamiensis]|uniref:hypothetical protein n=1 Tax=Burkholderia vietnamiensis TaxID=60552 RepID=UPI00075BE03D|nr:hypothetical protein [Burkholderia vietnamiensis]KVS07756.1 hypothetical protein WK32_09470 [Burkholderia vietnamiensis]